MAIDISATEAVLGKRRNVIEAADKAYASLITLQNLIPILTSDPLFANGFGASYVTFLNTLGSRCKTLTDNWPVDPTR